MFKLTTFLLIGSLSCLADEPQQTSTAKRLDLLCEIESEIKKMELIGRAEVQPTIIIRLNRMLFFIESLNTAPPEVEKLLRQKLEELDKRFQKIQEKTRKAPAKALSTFQKLIVGNPII